MSTPDSGQEKWPGLVNGHTAQELDFQKVTAGAFDALSELAAWADILETAGWTRTKAPDTQTLQAWKRPDKTGNAVSAKVLRSNPHVLVNHSRSSGLPIGGGNRLTKARVLAHLHYAGDQSALAKDLVRGKARGLPGHINAAFVARCTEPGER